MSNGARQERDAESGFTLIEVLVAMALMVVVCVGIAPLFAISIGRGRNARDQTAATILASAKLEELRSLTWSYETRPGLTPISRTDVTTNLASEFPAPDGHGLVESPPGTLEANVPPYVDYLDVRGAWLGTGSRPPARAVFLRRWAVHRSPADPERFVILQVLVVPVAEALAGGGAEPRAWTGTDALVATMIARKASR